MLSPEEIKKNFPIFDRKINNRKIIYLDSAATTQKPKQVVDAIVDYYYKSNSNVHRGIYRLSDEATELYNKSRENVASFVGANNSSELVFLRNTTEALNLLSYTLGRRLHKGDEILLTVMEHHSNLVPWQFLQEKGVKLRFAEIDDEGKLDVDDFQSKINDNTKIVSVTHVSNLLGTINDVKSLGKIAHENGSLFVVDGAQSAPHMKVDVKGIDCDFFAFSGHKMLAPTGIGGLYGKIDLLEKMDPFMGGGEMINTVSLEKSTWAEVPLKFEAGTPNIEGAIGFSAAVDFLRGIGMENVRAHEKDLIKYTLKREEEAAIPNLKSYGPMNPEIRGGVYSFNLGEIPPLDLSVELNRNGIGVDTGAVHPHDVASGLDKMSISVRSGHHCAMPLSMRLGVVATSRASYYIYNTREDVDALFEALKSVSEMYRR